jgi:endonuclease-8
MPEGDSLHRAAARLQVLVGQSVEVETPNPRAQAARIAERLDGRRLESVRAVGKNLLLSFEGGLVLRSHLRMSGRWRVERRDTAPQGTERRGRPWLVLRGAEHEAVLWNGPVLELHARGLERLGPDIVAEPLDLDGLLTRLRARPARELGAALLDQRLVSGVGNVWKAEALWHARLSPWTAVGAVPEGELRALLAWLAGHMRASVEGVPLQRNVYRRVGRPCPRCGTPIRSRGQGDDNRIAYWCPRCQQAQTEGMKGGTA